MCVHHVLLEGCQILLDDIPSILTQRQAEHGPRSYNENIETKLSFSTGPCLACLGFASTCTFVQSYIATYEWGGTGSPSLKNCPSSCGFLSSSTHRWDNSLSWHQGRQGRDRTETSRKEQLCFNVLVWAILYMIPNVAALCERQHLNDCLRIRTFS